LETAGRGWSRRLGQINFRYDWESDQENRAKKDGRGARHANLFGGVVREAELRGWRKEGMKEACEAGNQGCGQGNIKKITKKDMSSWDHARHRQGL